MGLQARKLVQKQIDQYLHLVKKGDTGRDVFEGDKFTITRSNSGPAITLNVKWRGEALGIDVVVCLKSEDVSGRYLPLLFIKPISLALLITFVWTLSPGVLD